MALLIPVWDCPSYCEANDLRLAAPRIPCSQILASEITEALEQIVKYFRRPQGAGIREEKRVCKTLPPFRANISKFLSKNLFIGPYHPTFHQPAF